MKKWVILVLVVLGGAMLALQYLMNKKAPGPGQGTQTGQQTPGGVPLPAGATDYSETPFVPPMGNFNDDPNRLEVPIVPSDYKGACEGGSLREMLATYNKYWGPLAKETPFSQNDTRQMLSFVGDYVSCVAIARDNALICDMLPPGPPDEGGPKSGVAAQAAPVDRSRAKPNRDNLRYACKTRVNPVLFLAYMAGKSKSPDSCNNILAGWKPSALARISVADFCSAASKGMDAVNEYMQKVMAGRQKKVKKGDDRSKQRFATSESSCGGNKECINGAKLYNAIKSGNVSQCPPPAPRSQQPGFKESGAPPERPAKGKEQAPTMDVMCQAAVTKSALSCEPIIKGMSAIYCDAMEQTKKRTGGFIGLSKAEIENALAEKKRQQKEEELRKEESEKRLMEINKNIKKMFGKD